MPAMLELLALGSKPRLDVVARLLDQLAALKRQVEDLLNQIAALKAPLEQARRRSHRQAGPSSKDRPQVHPKRPGRKPGRGPFTFRAAPELDSATDPTVDVRHSEPSCPCCRRSLDLDGIEAASTTEISPRPRPIV